MQAIPPFDPSARRGPLYRAVQAFTRTGTGRALAINLAAKADPLLLKWSGGRLGMGLVMPTAALTTTGAKSGAKRTAAVLYFTDASNRPGSGADVILIASNFGRRKHPSWYYNLRAEPQAILERGGVRATYTAALVQDEAEHERLYALATKVFAGYADYKVRTDAVGRRIPIMRLTLTA